jgi:hypothetical protein
MYPLPDIFNVRNGAAGVAAAIVLDTLLQNTDRGGDVLVVPAADGSPKYDLCFCDNGWAVWFPGEMYTRPLVVRTMMNRWLQSMMTSSEPFDTPVFLAEALDRKSLRAQFGSCPVEFRDDNGRPSPREIVGAVLLRVPQLRPAIFTLSFVPRP